MLVLSRKVGERIVLRLQDGTKILIDAAYLRGSRMGIGITAPDDVEILRREVDERKAEAA